MEGVKIMTIDQLLESVDLDFEPRWVTKDKDGDVYLYSSKPSLFITGTFWQVTNDTCRYYKIGRFKIAEFEGKNTKDCIYEVPRKTTGNIKQIVLPALVDEQIENPSSRDIWIHTIVDKIAELVDAVNELKGGEE